MATSNRIIGNRYELLEKCGKGGQGSVFKIKDLKDNDSETHNIKAMKIVKNARNDDYQRAKREIDILKTINSQYIVEYFDSYFATDEFYIVMKFYGDGSLREIIRNGKLSDEKIRLWSEQLLKGINTLHNQEIMHRDIKPENLFVHKDDLVLGDLGLAKRSNSVISAVVGTMFYNAPELWDEDFEFNYSNKIDIWAFGCVLYEMIKSKRLFGNFFAIIKFKNQYLNTDGMLPLFQSILKNAIVKDPTQRYSAEDLLKLFE